MDPNEALRQIRLTIKQLQVEDKPVGGIALPQFIQHARDLAELVEGLDEWLSKDGFLPADWRSDDEKAEAAGRYHPQRLFEVVSDNSNHNLPIGATVHWLVYEDGVDKYTQGGDGDEVSIDPRDLREVTEKRIGTFPTDYKEYPRG